MLTNVASFRLANFSDECWRKLGFAFRHLLLLSDFFSEKYQYLSECSGKCLRKAVGDY